jgi:periplasmic protein TonB
MGLVEAKRYRAAHATRIMTSIALAMVGLIVLIRVWPPPSGQVTRVTFLGADHESIALEDIVPTRQAAAVRPPPPPLPPIAVEDPVELEFDDIPDFDASIPDLLGPPSVGRDVAGDEAIGSSTRAQSARPVRFVEPEYTRDARRRDIKAHIVVEVTVDERGRVESSRILERYLVANSAGTLEAVPQIGFGLEESALSAAQRFLFRPAEFRGEPVRSQYQLRFSFGV